MQAAQEELEQVKSTYEQKISMMEAEHNEQITQVKEELIHTKEVLSTEQDKLSKLNTEHVLSVQKCEQ